MARDAAIVLRLVRIWGTRGVTFVFVHHQVMLAAGALVRSVLTAGAVGLARHTRAVLGVCVMKCKKNRTLLRFHETEIIIIDEYKMIFCRHTFVVAFRTLLEADCQIGDSKMSGRAGETGVLTSARANFTGFVARPADTALVREAPWRTATDTCARRKKRHPSRCFSNDFTLRRVKRREKI